MKPPAVIRVGPYPYAVRFDATELNEYRRDSGKDLGGKGDHSRLRLTVDPTLAADQQADTLLHEVCHAVLATTGVRGDVKLTEEAFISHLTPLLLDTLRRNPLLVAYLLEPDHE